MNERRITRLNINAPNETLARRGAILVEDAFRTASLPDPGGRLLVIRRLSLGSVRSSRGPAAIALAIEQRLRLLGSAAVYAGDPSADRHDIVYFENEAEPFILLAVRLACGQNTNAWFWPLAVRCFSPGMSRDGALRAMLYESANTGANAAALVEVVRTLVEHDAADRLLEALRSQDGPHLLRTIGCLMPEPRLERVEDALEIGRSEFSRRWSDSVARWASRWGMNDTRSVWLAAVALIAEQPARALDPYLGRRARQMIERVTMVLHPRETQIREQEKTLIDDLKLTTGTGQPEAPESRLSAFAENERIEDVDRSLDSNPLTAAMTTTTQVRNDGVSGHPHQPFFTRYAGMFFLLPIMSRLGMSTLLEDDPKLIDCDLPMRLLLHASLRLGIEREDEMAHALATMCSRENPALSGFIQPAIWNQGIFSCQPLIVRRVAGSAGERILFDGSGRLALAWWRGQVPDGLRHLSGDREVRRGTSLECRDGQVLLLDSWLMAIRRWSRRYARIGLRDLVCRPGRISVTNTHIDAMFDHRLADVRIRKAGLDLDPGWMPWLGRVVSFHYEYGECVDG